MTRPMNVPGTNIIEKGTAVGFIPARGGSKSIKLKNMALLDNKPLVGHSIDAALGAKSLQKIVCSTENPVIMQYCMGRGVDVDHRPDHLCGDEVHIKDVLREFLMRMARDEKWLPELLCLLQPTSPFTHSSDVDSLNAMLFADPKSDSAQTIARIPHNYHAWNQRIVNDEFVSFYFEKERKTAFNKQKKPDLYSFGNLVSTRVSHILEGGDCFGGVSRHKLIDRRRALDVDTSEDLEFANQCYCFFKSTHE